MEIGVAGAGGPPCAGGADRRRLPHLLVAPAGPTVTGRYGIWDADRLVACGADRSRGDIGFLAGLTVARDRRGRGLGVALTAGTARALFARYDHVAPGVYADNLAALRLYRRVGFTGTSRRSSVWLG
ncbi:GNAT family N-acetyltransferase [Micromonospora wenchangensis]|uniref:GNAT family N-acetyltransferase n=1 Tax=Micromonospora wenchangensis TaxID=1185415 RepID=UPI0038213308